METVCIKVEEGLSKRMENSIRASGYSTKTEFIREAIRDKLDANEQDILIKEFMKTRGKAKRTVSDSQLKKIREQAFLDLAKEKGWDV